MTLPRTHLKPVIWLAGCLVTLAISTAAGFMTAKRVTGVIKTIDDRSLVMTIKTGEEVFQLDSDTKISLNDKPAKVSDLRPGDSAIVAANGGKATAIDAHRGNKPGNPDPASHRREVHRSDGIQTASSTT